MQSCIADEGFQFLPYPGSLGLVFGRYFYAQLLCTPGEKYYYSNPAFMLAAYFIEKFSGISLERYVTDHIVKPVRPSGAATYFDKFNGKFLFDPSRVGEYYKYIDLENRRKVLQFGVCSSEFDLGSASGAGGIVSSQADIADLYFTLFNFSAGFTGAPLFRQRQTLFNLVRPRTLVNKWSPGENVYYAQGLFVVAPTTRRSEYDTTPTLIFYEGEIICSHTANIFRVATNSTPAMMAQVWSAVRVAYATGAQLHAAEQSRDESFPSLWSKLITPPKTLTDMAFELMEYFS